MEKRLFSAKFLLILLAVLLLTACSAPADRSSGLENAAGDPGGVSAALAASPGSPATATAVPSAEPQTPTSTGPNPTALSASGTPLPAPTHTFPPPASPSPSAAPQPELLQLTSGGCCVQAFWAPDGQGLLYIDKPNPEAPSGLWRAPIPAGDPQFFTDRLGIFSPNMSWRAYPSGNQTVVEGLEAGAQTGEQFVINNGGRAVSFSPDGQWLAWTAGQSGPPLDSAQREVWISRTDGSQARPVLQIYGGGFAGWLLDNRLLVSGRTEPGAAEQALFVLEPMQGETLTRSLDQLLADGALVELARGARVRDALPSPLGQWVAFHVTFDADPARNGLWIANTFSGQKARVEPYGAFRWRDGDELLVIPLAPGQPQAIIQLEAAQTEAGVVLNRRLLTDPNTTPFSVANGDWNVSPDGKFVNFLNAADQNIWLIRLP